MDLGWYGVARSALFAHRGDPRPYLSFHGTAAHNIPNIERQGFVVPGKHGVVVANGSVHGVGIYVASQAVTSCSYMRGSDSLLVCAGITRVPSNKLKDVSSIHVYSEEHLVAPVALINVATRYSHGHEGIHHQQWAAPFANAHAW